MKSLVRFFTLVSIMFFCAITPGHAADDYRGLYGAIGGGFTSSNDFNTSVSGTAVGIEPDRGHRINGALGYDFGNFRTELEVFYSNSDMENVTDLKGRYAANGDVESTGVMFNVALEKTIDIWTPYVVVGGGFVRTEGSFRSMVDLGTYDWRVDDSDTAFAYQLGAGMMVELNSSWLLDVSYKWMKTSPTLTDASGDSVDYENSSHNVMVGLVFRF